MGDATDGINGLGGIGEVKANKILKNWIDGNIETFILCPYIDRKAKPARVGDNPLGLWSPRPWFESAAGYQPFLCALFFQTIQFYMHAM